MVLDKPGKIEDEHILILQHQEDGDKKDPYSSFMWYGLKAPETRRQWPICLKKFFDFGINPKLDLQKQSTIFMRRLQIMKMGYFLYRKFIEFQKRELLKER
jgi:hypothetical protein